MVIAEFWYEESTGVQDSLVEVASPFQKVYL